MTQNFTEGSGVRWRCAATGARYQRLLDGTAAARRGHSTRSAQRSYWTPKAHLLVLRLDVLGWPVFAPGIVGVCENQAISEGRVRVHPESNECRRVRIGEIDFAQRLETVGGDLG